MLTLITPTGDRHAALRCCDRWMKQQTFTGNVQWIIVDDGVDKSMIDRRYGKSHWNIDYVSREGNKVPSVFSFIGNLLAAIPLIQGDKILVIEDDDYYSRGHLAEMVARLDCAEAAGDSRQHYYHVPSARWCDLVNRGSSLAQTGFRRRLLPTFKDAVDRSLARESYGVDAMFWGAVRNKHSGYSYDLFDDKITVVGIKGYPGRPGLGMGHRPDESKIKWEHDPYGRKLAEWLGDDAGSLLIEYGGANGNQ